MGKEVEDARHAKQMLSTAMVLRVAQNLMVRRGMTCEEAEVDAGTMRMDGK